MQTSAAPLPPTLVDHSVGNAGQRSGI